MSMPGWYPDPAGTPHRFRYWDGQSWSHDTTDNPGATPPGGTPPAGSGSGGGGGAGTPSGPGRQRRRLGPVIVIIALALVLVVAGVLVLRQLSATRPIVDPGPLPSASVSGWDDSSPTAEPETSAPTPSASSPTPTATPSPKPSSEAPVQPCPTGQPTVRQDHPSDGRVHGGGLSFPKVSGWEDISGAGFSWAYDVGAQRKLLEPEWQASLAVGALFTGDGFDEPRRAAELVLQCMITSGFYDQTAERADIWSKATTVDGHPAWSIRADVRIDDPNIEAEGDTVDVIVVDTGSPESLAMFVGAVSIGDVRLLRTLDSTIKNLRVD